MEVSVKRKFIPQTQEESTDINTSLFVLIQIISESVNSKKLLVNYLKRDGEGCIFYGIQDLLKSVSIELELVPIDESDLFSSSLIKKPPHLFYGDDILKDPAVSEAMLHSVPTTYVISRVEKDFDLKLGEAYYLPLYKIGKGKDKLELARWNVSVLWKKIGSSRKSIVFVRSESDLEDMRKSLKLSSIHYQMIIVTKYPDEFGVKEKVLEHRMKKNDGNAYVVLTNSDVDEKTVKMIMMGGLACSVFKDGIWGGEYFVPTLKSN